jgi:hypothetical protein
MKEVLTKKFWRDVKKTFDEARAETPPKSEDSPAAVPAEAKSETGPTTEASPETPRPPH